MRWTTFIISCCLYLALFFVVQRQPLPDQPYFFSKVVDLTDARTLMNTSASANRVPPERLVVPAVVLSTMGRISMNDVTDYENSHGRISSGAVVFAKTSSRACVNFASEVVKFLVETRNISGVASNSDCVKARSTQAHTAHLYQLVNVSGLSSLPPAGAMAIIAPSKAAGGSSGPVRILALVQ